MEIIHFQERHGPGAQDMHLVSLIFQPADDTFQPLIIAGEPGVSLNEDGLGALEKRAGEQKSGSKGRCKNFLLFLQKFLAEGFKCVTGLDGELLLC